MASIFVYYTIYMVNKRAISLLSLTICALAAYAIQCGTGKVATKENRVATECQSNWYGPSCYDEKFINGGCSSPFQQDIKCTEAPMTNPISVNVYTPRTINGSCQCMLSSTNTPSPQTKGIMGGACNPPADGGLD